MRVVAGVVLNSTGQVLLAQRPEGKHLAGFWEFPGGKMEPLESETETLTRELKEELELDVEIRERMGEFPFQYVNQELILIAYLCEALSEPQATEQVQNFQWLSPTEIKIDTLAPADVPILEKIFSLSDRGLRHSL